MMAYFSNSTEGMILDELCSRCVHGWDGEKNRQGAACAVIQLQMMWNYDQCEREDRGTISTKSGNVTATYQIGELTREAVVKKMALDMLVPNRGDVICAMFVDANE
jgi:hypothetical protein